MVTCMNLAATSLKPLCSKRLMISPHSPLWTPSGFTAMKVRSMFADCRHDTNEEEEEAQKCEGHHHHPASGAGPHHGTKLPGPSAERRHRLVNLDKASDAVLILLPADGGGGWEQVVLSPSEIRVQGHGSRSRSADGPRGRSAGPFGPRLRR